MFSTQKTRREREREIIPEKVEKKTFTTFCVQLNVYFLRPGSQSMTFGSVMNSYFLFLTNMSDAKFTHSF